MLVDYKYRGDSWEKPGMRQKSQAPGPVHPRPRLIPVPGGTVATKVAQNPDRHPAAPCAGIHQAPAGRLAAGLRRLKSRKKTNQREGAHVPGAYERFRDLGRPGTTEGTEDGKGKNGNKSRVDGEQRGADQRGPQGTNGVNSGNRGAVRKNSQPSRSRTPGISDGPPNEKLPSVVWVGSSWGVSE